MVKTASQANNKNITQVLEENLWEVLKLQDLSPEDKADLLEELCDTVEQRWLRRLAEKLASVPELDEVKLQESTIDEKLAVINQYIPESLTMLLEEVDLLKIELSGLVSASEA